MDKYKERIKQIQSFMQRDNIDMYIADDADPFLSEYVNDYYKMRSFLSGFTGSSIFSYM